MKKIFITETRRMYKLVFLIVGIALLALIFISDLDVKYNIMYYTVTVVFLTLTLCFCFDLLTDKNLLYFHSSINGRKVIISKYLSTLFLVTCTIIVLGTYLNISVLKIRENNYLQYLRFNADNYGFIVVGRKPLEYLYMLNYLLSASFYFFLITGLFLYYRHLQYKKREKWVDFIISGIFFLVPAYIMLLISRFFTDNNVLNFNFVSRRIRGFVPLGLEVNFLCVPNILMYVIAIILLLKYIKKEEQ